MHVIRSNLRNKLELRISRCQKTVIHSPNGLHLVQKVSTGIDLHTKDQEMGELSWTAPILLIFASLAGNVGSSRRMRTPVVSSL